jgi:DNA-binding GntR family transcriptional regulator
MQVAFKRKADAVEDRIRQEILYGGLRPGDRLPLEDLAKRLGVSMTPVREAMLHLEADGLVIYEPHKGARVAGLSLDEIRVIYDMREALETLATRLAVSRLTDTELAHLEETDRQARAAYGRGDLAAVRQCNFDFHMTLYRASRGRTLAKMVETLLASSPFNFLWNEPERARQSFAEHTTVLSALRRRDEDAAVEAMREHIVSVGRDILEQLAEAAASAPFDGTVPVPFVDRARDSAMRHGRTDMRRGAGKR